MTKQEGHRYGEHDQVVDEKIWRAQERAGDERGRLQVDAVASLRAPRTGRHEALEAIGLPEAWRELAAV